MKHHDAQSLITLEMLATSKLVHRAHLDGPRGKDGWFGDVYGSVEHPRLARFDKCVRADRTVHVSWMVDGVVVGPLLALAIDKLNQPPDLTIEEIAAVCHVTDELQDLRKTVDIRTLIGLRDKGVVEFVDGKCRLRRASELYVSIETFKATPIKEGDDGEG